MEEYVGALQLVLVSSQHTIECLGHSFGTTPTPLHSLFLWQTLSYACTRCLCVWFFSLHTSYFYYMSLHFTPPTLLKLTSLNPAGTTGSLKIDCESLQRKIKS